MPRPSEINPPGPSSAGDSLQPRAGDSQQPRAGEQGAASGSGQVAASGSGQVAASGSGPVAASDSRQRPPLGDAWDPGNLGRAKAELRSRILAARLAMPDDVRGAAGRALRDAVLSLPEMQMAGTVAAYISMGTEPDTRGLVFALWKRGTYVLLPVLLPDGDLDWATYEGPDSLVSGPRGLLEPAEARRGVTAVTSADLVIVPAVAVDRAGRRLGRGGGSYDRALDRVGAAVLTVALLYAGELVAEVPAGAHDQPVRAAATPDQGISRLR